MVGLFILLEVIYNKKELIKKINIDNKTITPGFIDARSHPASSGRSHLRKVDCDLRSIEEIKSAIYERTKITPKGNWISGFKYDDTKTNKSFN